MKLGVTLFNFHREIKTLSDLDNVLSFLKSLGTNTVQISGISHIPYADAAVLCPLDLAFIRRQFSGYNIEKG